MIQTVAYFLLLVSITIYCIISKKHILGIVLLLLYTSVAGISILALVTNTVPSDNISLLPYLFLVLAYIIAFFPFLQKKNEFTTNKVTSGVNRNYQIFAFVYCVFGLRAISLYLPKILSLLREGDWSVNRLSLYDGTMQDIHTNIIDYLILQFVSYFFLLALVVGFQMIKGSNRKLGFATILVAASYVVSVSIYTSSRGTLLNMAMIMVALYLFHYEGMKKSVKKIFMLIALVGVILVMQYIIDVTVSRFNNNNAVLSLIQYLGESPIYFNSGVFNITDIMLGKFSFGKLFGVDYFSPSSIGGTWGSHFYTFVGWLYIDWWALGALLIEVFVVYIILIKQKKKTYQISDVYIIFFYYYTLLQGVFVIGRTYCYSIIATLLIYWFLKTVVEKYKFKFGKYAL